MLKQNLPSKLLVFILLLPLLAMTGCLKGDTGPAGADGSDGTDGTDGWLFDYTYLGSAHCQHCHTNLVDQVASTPHTNALSNMDAEDQDNPYCLKCHVTGWDSPVNYGDTEIAEYGPDLFGYDDYWGVEGEVAAERRAALEGVQCESCHGAAGPNLMEYHGEVSFATRTEGDTSLSLCAPCHSGQLSEWAESGHGHHEGSTIEEFNEEHFVHSSSCQPCHTSEGFIMANDPSYANYELPEDHVYSFIGCVTCHDPHVGTDGGGNDDQLRQVGDVEVEYHPGYEDGDEGLPTMSGYGNGQICGQCHHARRDTDNVTNQIANGYRHFGPHSSPQMDMYIGAGAYEIPDWEYTSEHIHQTSIADGCISCHMVRVEEIHGESQAHAFHSFTPEVGNCEPCHVGLPDFDYHGVQTTVAGLMDDLATRFGYADAAAMLDHDTGWDSEGDGVEAWQREAAYALYFVNSDGSMGVHNPSYAIDLLENAIGHYDVMDPPILP